MNEIKVRPKFRTIFLSDDVPSVPKLRELKYWCRKFGKKGLMPFYGSGSFGNMSFRLKKNMFVITATGIKDPSSSGSFVTISSVDLGKKIVRARGKREPSSESMLHYAIYKKRKDVNAIFHGHDSKILKTSKKMSLPATQRKERYGTLRLVRSVLKALKDHDFLIMKGHGFLSLGRNMDGAGERALKIADISTS